VRILRRPDETIFFLPLLPTIFQPSMKKLLFCPVHTPPGRNVRVRRGWLTGDLFIDRRFYGEVSLRIQ